MTRIDDDPLLQASARLIDALRPKPPTEAQRREAQRLRRQIRDFRQRFPVAAARIDAEFRREAAKVRRLVRARLRARKQQSS